MEDEPLQDQRTLVERIEAEGWDVTDVELSQYDSPWDDEGTPEATVTITARKLYPRESDRSDDDEERDNPFRVK